MSELYGYDPKDLATIIARRSAARHEFTRYLNNLCTVVKARVLEVVIHWEDHGDPFIWESVSTVDIVYVNGHTKEVNCRLNSIQSTAWSVIQNL